ncbi:MAG: hypothetical protein ABI388_10805 [Bacteroidia bacterium]
METSKPENQKDASDNADSDNLNKTQPDYTNDELRIVAEKGMVGQPMGNRIENTSFKNMTPAEKDGKQEPEENYIKSVKQKQN